MWEVNVLTLFPELFPGALSTSIVGRALRKQLWQLNIFDIRAFAKDSRVDDIPYGGGAGMVMRPDVLGNNLDYIIDKIKIIEKNENIEEQRNIAQEGKQQRIGKIGASTNNKLKLFF